MMRSSSSLQVALLLLLWTNWVHAYIMDDDDDDTRPYRQYHFENVTMEQPITTIDEELSNSFAALETRKINASCVFDRRRTKHPSRTPAPLSQQKGLFNGYLGFAWWRLRLDDESQKHNWDEYRQLMQERTNNTVSVAVLAVEEYNVHMMAAEQQVYRESPFFRQIHGQSSSLLVPTLMAPERAPPTLSSSSQWTTSSLNNASNYNDTPHHDNIRDVSSSSFHYEPSENFSPPPSRGTMIPLWTTQSTSSSMLMLESNDSVDDLDDISLTLEDNNNNSHGGRNEEPISSQDSSGVDDDDDDETSSFHDETENDDDDNNKEDPSNDDDNPTAFSPSYCLRRRRILSSPLLCTFTGATFDDVPSPINCEEESNVDNEPSVAGGFDDDDDDDTNDDDDESSTSANDWNDVVDQAIQSLVRGAKTGSSPKDALGASNHSHASQLASVLGNVLPPKNKNNSNNKNKKMDPLGNVSNHSQANSVAPSQLASFLGNVTVAADVHDSRSTLPSIDLPSQTNLQVVAILDDHHHHQADTDFVNSQLLAVDLTPDEPGQTLLWHHHQDHPRTHHDDDDEEENMDYDTSTNPEEYGYNDEQSAAATPSHLLSALGNIDSSSVAPSVAKSVAHSVATSLDLNSVLGNLSQMASPMSNRSDPDKRDLVNSQLLAIDLTPDEPSRTLLGYNNDEEDEPTEYGDYGYNNDEAQGYGYGDQAEEQDYGYEPHESAPQDDYGYETHEPDHGDNSQEETSFHDEETNHANQEDNEYGYGNQGKNYEYDDQDEDEENQYGYGVPHSGPKFVPMKGSDNDDDDDGGMLSRIQRSNSLDASISFRNNKLPMEDDQQRRSSAGHMLDHRRNSGGRGRSIMHHGSSDLKSGGSMHSNGSGGISGFLKSRVLMMQDTNDDSDGFNGGETANTGLIATKITKRPLSVEDQELLRCIGLDSFVTLRFLKFGFDVSFWPLVLAIFTIMPVFKTANNGVLGFFSISVVALESGDWRYWAVMIFGIIHFSYILRRIWIEWEVFLPLRYEFLENGDFEKEKYKEQFRKTCMIEYIPRERKHDKTLYEFFDAISPGNIERAEVLLNTEHLRALIKERMGHITSYEDVYARKVHDKAKYLRRLDKYQQIEESRFKCCNPTRSPTEPAEPMLHRRLKTDKPQSIFTIRGGEKVEALTWHFENIQRLNKDIDQEYLRLAQAQRRPVVHAKESRLAKWLGLKYLTGSDTGRLHSSTAFVQFKNLAAKQHAIQCNITGMHNYMTVNPVPEVRDIMWDNMHVSRALIETRKAWVNAAFAGGLLLWSMLVSYIRSLDNIAGYVEQTFHNPITSDPAMAAFLNFYAPALIVEGLVRTIPNFMKVAALWVRFKSHSENDHYILRWYFGYRLLTFVFIIIGGTIVKSSNEFLNDPIGFFEALSGNVALNAQFFMSYVVVSGGIQVFFRLSQWHNVALYWLMKSVKKAEALSQRKLQDLATRIQVFHLDEFIPLFIFIFMVGALYGTIAPIAGVFVSGFFFVAYKVFRFMTLFIYGNHYQGGGFLFYTISTTLFYVLYMIILLIVFFFSVNANRYVATGFSMLLFLTFYVQRDVEKTFVEPSKTLSLAKARSSDETNDTRNPKERAQEELSQAQQRFDEASKEEANTKHQSASDKLRLLSRQPSGESLDSLQHGSIRRGGRRNTNMNANSVADAVQAFNDRYNGDDPFADDSDEEDDLEAQPQHPRDAFFIYRQPSLNKATWEMVPKPYREGLERDEAAEVWGDERPEQTRKVARQRRASIAQYYGG